MYITCQLMLFIDTCLVGELSDVAMQTFHVRDKTTAVEAHEFFLVQVLSAKAQVLLLEDVIVSNGLKSIPAQTHVQPGIQQDHVYDAGKPHPPSTLNISKRCSCAAARRHGQSLGIS